MNPNVLNNLNVLYYEDKEVKENLEVLEFFTLKDECFYVAKKIADVKGKSLEEIADITYKNANKIYNIK